jgi:hypothetical protein
MPRYTVKICPNSISDNSLEYDHGVSLSVAEQEDGSFRVIVPVCRIGSYCHSGQITKVKLCPIGETCGCNYEASISWIGYTKDRTLVKWDNPDKCILDKIELKAKTVWGQSWNTIMKYIHTKSGDPNVILYPDGDSRNNEYCHECGIGGDGSHPPGVEEVWDAGKIIPGMMYRVDGFFRNETCGGVGQGVVLGYSLYETPALTSGEIAEVVVDDSGKQVHPPQYKVDLYSNDPDEYPLTVRLTMYSVDYYPWEVGDPVTILKDRKTYPGGEPIDDRENAPGGPAYVRFNSGNTERDEDSLVISAYEILEGYYGLV